MRRVLSLLMALVMATGVCLCISSCEEAGDTSSSHKGPTGYDIIARSAAKDTWDAFVHGSKCKSIEAYFGEERYTATALGVSEEYFIRIKPEIAEITAALTELESHIVKELTEDEVKRLDYQRLAKTSEAVLIDLAEITMYDYSPEIIKGLGVKIGDGEMIGIVINERYLSVGGKAYFELDGAASDIIDRIKVTRDNSTKVLG